MSFIRRTVRAASRRLAIRIDDLCETLNTIANRVRAATADAIGETISIIVRDAALYALDKISPKPSGDSTVRSSSRQRIRSNHDELWDSENEEHDAYFDESQVDDDEPSFDSDEPDVPNQLERFSLALSAGLQIAAWWFKRQTARGLMMSIGVTLATSGLAYFAGPFARVFTMLIESATRCVR